MKLFKRATLLFGGLLAGLLLAELLARIFLPVPTRQIALLRMRAPDLQMDAGTDLKNPNYNPFLQRRPGSEWVCDGKRPERMNNEGFRGRDFVEAKTPGVLRLAVLGDSFAEGWMGPRDAAFPLQLEQQLGSGVEVLNFSLANRSPLRYAALYDQIVRKYRPDAVLVCLYRNDPAEDEGLRPYVTFDAQGVPQKFDFARYFRHTPRMPQTKWEKRRDKWQWHLCRYSRLFPYAAVALTVDPEFRKRTLEEPPSTAFDALWRNTSAHLGALQRLVEADGARLFLAYVPDRADFTAPHPLQAASVAHGREHAVPVHDASGFLSEANPAAFYLPDDGHFNPEGHRHYAERLAGWIKPLISGPARSAPASRPSPKS